MSVESSDKFENSTLAVDCSDEEFRTIGASLYQTLQRTTEPLRMVDKCKERRGSKRSHFLFEIPIVIVKFTRVTVWWFFDFPACVVF